MFDLLKKSFVVLEMGIEESHLFSRKVVKWEDIVNISAVRLNKITYDEIFILIYGKNFSISIGELDRNFTDIERSVRVHFSSIPENWPAFLQDGDLDELELWPTFTAGNIAIGS